MSQSKPKVLVCVLTSTERQGWINPELSMMLVNMARDSRFQMEYATIKDSRPVECARNQALVLARDHGFEWCVQIDNDNFMPQGTPFDIIATAGPDQNVIGLSYGVMSATHGYAMFPPDHSQASPRPFQEVPDTGGGVLMVHRSVWQKIPGGPWFRWDHGEPTETLDKGPNGCGEDVYFCRLVREHGLRVFTHTMPAGHYRSADLTGMVCTMSHLTQQARAVHAVPQRQSSKWVTQ